MARRMRAGITSAAASRLGSPSVKGRGSGGEVVPLLAALALRCAEALQQGNDGGESGAHVRVF